MTFGTETGAAIDAEIARAVKAEQDRLVAVWDARETEYTNVISGMTKAYDAALAEIKRLVAKYETPPMLVGAGGGNSDRTKQTGVKIDRRYYGAGDVAKAVSDVQRNAAAGVRSWISFKVPFTWAQMAAGSGDTWARDLYTRLATLGTEVWVAFHHEPEGDGVLTDWTKMQDRLSRMVPSSSIKFWLIVTGWHQSKGTNALNRWPALYPKGAPVFGIAYDYPYQAYGQTTNKTTGAVTFTKVWTDPNYYVDAVADAAAELSASEGRKIEAGIAEWGYGDEAYTRERQWVDKVLSRGKERALLAFTYFDTTLNSSHSWYLGAPGSEKRVYVEGVFARFNAM